MWNLGEPGSRFRAAAPKHPEALLEEPQAFQAVGEKKKPMLNPNSCAMPQAKPMGSPNWSGFTRNFAKSRLKPFAWNLGTACIHYLETFTWNFGTSWILYLEPWLGTWAPLGTLTWNPYKLPNPLLGTLTWNLGTFQNWNPYLEPLLGTLEPPESLTWNPYLNLATFRNLCLEPLVEPCGMTAPECPRA